MKIKINEVVIELYEDEGYVDFETLPLSAGWDKVYQGGDIYLEIPGCRTPARIVTGDVVFPGSPDKLSVISLVLHQRHVLKGNVKEFGDTSYPILIRRKSGLADELDSYWIPE